MNYLNLLRDKFLGKILVNKIQPHIKKIIYHEQIVFTPGCENGLTYTKLLYKIAQNYKEG
jgi:hypothetical protein